MAKTISLSDAVTKVQAVLENKIQFDGRLQRSVSGGFSIAWELGWGVDARLSVHDRFNHAGDCFDLQVQVTWSSTGLSPVATRTGAMLHAHAADLACLAETVIQCLPKIEIA